MFISIGSPPRTSQMKSINPTAMNVTAKLDKRSCQYGFLIRRDPNIADDPRVTKKRSLTLYDGTDNRLLICLLKFISISLYSDPSTDKIPHNLCASLKTGENELMRINHIAIWTNDLERLRRFYVRYFNAEHGSKYVNEKRGFESYFLRFSSGAKVELMYLPSSMRSKDPGTEFVGYAHIAISVGSKENVDDLTSRLRANGHSVLSNPRYTGDGFYESVVSDPDGNHIEITI